MGCFGSERRGAIRFSLAPSLFRLLDQITGGGGRMLLCFQVKVRLFAPTREAGRFVFGCRVLCLPLHLRLCFFLDLRSALSWPGSEDAVEVARRQLPLRSSGYVFSIAKKNLPHAARGPASCAFQKCLPLHRARFADGRHPMQRAVTARDAHHALVAVPTVRSSERMPLCVCPHSPALDVFVPRGCATDTCDDIFIFGPRGPVLP